jgi:hypothetical protein
LSKSGNCELQRFVYNFPIYNAKLFLFIPGRLFKDLYSIIKLFKLLSKDSFAYALLIDESIKFILTSIFSISIFSIRDLHPKINRSDINDDIYIFFILFILIIFKQNVILN